jgi:ketosteroid isomerase-like protein
MIRTTPFVGFRVSHAAMFWTIACFFACSALAVAASPSKDDAQIWSSEKEYWEDVKANDLEKYRSLWHEDFLGWPSVSPNPLGKSHITDWITTQTSKGLKLQSYSIEPLAVHVTGDVAIDHYRITMNWTKAGTSEAAGPEVTRITHTWIRIDGRWQILGGMSAPVNAEGK